jgi:hypothetical protein
MNAYTFVEFHISLFHVSAVRASHFAHLCSTILSLYIKPMTRPSLCDFCKCKKDFYRIDWCFGRAYIR